MSLQLAHLPVPEYFLIWLAGCLAIVIGVSISMKLSDIREKRVRRKKQKEDEEKDNGDGIH